MAKMTHRETKQDAARRIDGGSDDALGASEGQGREYTPIMGRTILVCVGLVVGVFLVIQWFSSDDRDIVEKKIEHLAQLAEQGGEAAVAEILDVFAEDCTGSYSRRFIQSQVRRLVGPNTVKKVTLGNFETIWRGDAIFVPLLRIDVTTRGQKGTILLKVTFEERDGVWLVTDVSRWSFER